MNKNSIFPSNKTAAKKPNRMWVPILTTVGLSAAMYGLRKYKNGKLMNPIQNFMKKFQNTGIQSVLAGATSNPLTEFSQELTNMNAASGSQQNTANQNSSGTQQSVQGTANMSSQQNTAGNTNNQNKTQ